MAAIGMMVAGAAVNALCFSGSNYLFSHINDDEMKRHDTAMEELAKAREIYQEKKEERLNYINDKMRQMGHSVQTFTDVDQAMEEYYTLTGSELKSIGPEPTLDDYYTISGSQQVLDVVLILGGLGVGYYVVKRMT